jgi:hypothetical protein
MSLRLLIPRPQVPATMKAMTANRLRSPPRRAIAAKLGRNSRREEFLLGACMWRVEDHVSQETRWGWDGASLESVSGFSHDPIGYRGGLNLYEYCGDSPLTRFDPTGLDDKTLNPLLFPFDPPQATYVGGGAAAPQGPINPTLPLAPPPTKISDLPTTLPSIAKCRAAKCIARRMAEAIGNTYNLNGRPASPWSEKRKGYYCHEWAWAFKYACDSERPNEFFKMKVRMCWNEDCSKTHAWVEITSVETGKTICVDDGFTEGGSFVHWTPPQCYTCGPDDMPESERGHVPLPYDSCGCGHRVPRVPKAK